MGDAKQIVVRPIERSEADRMVMEHHYSGTTYNKSRLHIGVFYLGRLEGAMQFGPPLDQRKVMPLVAGSEWQGMMELNRMAFSGALPRNSESRALGVAFRVIRAKRPDIKWILSYSDATRCGDGAIYRASGFVLTGIKENNGIYRMPDGVIVTNVGVNTGPALQKKYGFRPGIDSFSVWAARAGAVRLPGYQFRYIRFLDPEWASRLTVPVIPFDQIPDGCRMYRGEKTGAGPERGAPDQGVTGGADPTPALHSDESSL